MHGLPKENTQDLLMRGGGPKPDGVSDHFHPKSESEEYVQCGAELPIGCEPLPLS